MTKPKISLTRLSHYAALQTIVDDLADYDIQIVNNMSDKEYFHSDLDSWLDAMHWIYNIQKPSKYLSNEPTHIDWAFWVKANLHHHFGLTHCAIALGTLYGEPHSFLMFYSGSEWWVWEPQPGLQGHLILADGIYLPGYFII